MGDIGDTTTHTLKQQEDFEPLREYSQHDFDSRIFPQRLTEQIRHDREADTREGATLDAELSH